MAAAVTWCALSGVASAQTGWPSAGLDLKNSRYQSAEQKITARTVAGLHLKWAVDTDGDVTANPAVDGDYLYFPDSAGFLYKVRRDTGATCGRNALPATPASTVTSPVRRRPSPATR
jgi:hypothetical protein